VIACLVTTFGITSSSSKSVPAEMNSRMLKVSKPPSSRTFTEMPSEQPTISEQPTSSRFSALGDAIKKNYPGGSFNFVSTTNQYAALELLANSKEGVPEEVPKDSEGEYLVLQHYVLMLLYLQVDKNKKIGYKAGEPPCVWSRVTCSDSGTIEGLDRTYNTVTTEPVICNMRPTLTAVLFSKTSQLGTFRKPSY
jgi:hypothetical protein